MPGSEATIEAVPLIGGRRFWVYRGVDAAGFEDWAASFNAEFEARDADFEPSRGGTAPLGACVMVTDRALIEERRDVLWADTQLMYAGYTPDDIQLRIRYFEGAMV